MITCPKNAHSPLKIACELEHVLSIKPQIMSHNLLDALNVRVVGDGDRVLVLAHGFGTDQSAWQRVLPYFLPHYRVVLYDLVCAGSVNPGYFDFRRYSTLDGYVDDLLFILDALCIDCCAYVGHSVSAMIGILAAIRRPSLFTKLILIGASPRYTQQSGLEQTRINLLSNRSEIINAPSDNDRRIHDIRARCYV